MKVIALVLGGLILIVLALSAQRPFQNDKSDSRGVTRNYLSVFENLACPDSIDVMVIGDSHVSNFPWNLYVGELKIVGLGIPGLKIQELAKYNPVFTRCSSAFLVVQIGVNDLIAGVGAAEFERSYRELIERIREENSTRTVLMSTIPPTSRLQRKKVDMANDIINATSIELGVEVLHFDDEKFTLSNASETISYDGLHLNWNGYKNWVLSIEMFVRDRRE